MSKSKPHKKVVEMTTTKNGCSRLGSGSLFSKKKTPKQTIDITPLYLLGTERVELGEFPYNREIARDNM